MTGYRTFRPAHRCECAIADAINLLLVAPRRHRTIRSRSHHLARAVGSELSSWWENEGFCRDNLERETKAVTLECNSRPLQEVDRTLGTDQASVEAFFVHRSVLGV
jgi:hypothetical protein